MLFGMIASVMTKSEGVRHEICAKKIGIRIKMQSCKTGASLVSAAAGSYVTTHQSCCTSAGGAHLLLVMGGGHSASEEAHFRHFLIVSETVFVVFSVILIHILILFWPIWFCISKYGKFTAMVIFQ